MTDQPTRLEVTPETHERAIAFLDSVKEEDWSLDWLIANAMAAGLREALQEARNSLHALRLGHRVDLTASIDRIDAALSISPVIDTNEGLAERVRELEACIRDVLGTPHPGTWMEATSPLIERFTVAAKFDQQAVHNAEGSQALAQLMAAMATKLDNACARLGQAIRREGGRDA